MFTQDQFDNVEFIFPVKVDFEEFISQKFAEPFSDDVVDFLNQLSLSLFKRADIKDFPDISTFAFFCRKSNILLQKKHYYSDALRQGRGIIFHITPSNVPMNFAYSFVAGLLAGNVNIIRVPSVRFTQIEFICKAIALIAENPSMKFVANRLLFVRYDRTNKATTILSSVCDVRVIWGGDNSIEEIRRSQLPPRSYDITFAERYSICAINADSLVSENDIDRVVAGFYNDTYLFDQNACSSPHLVIWTGSTENIEIAKELFWNSLHSYVSGKYVLQPVTVVDKLTTFCNVSVCCGNSHITRMPDNLVWRIQIDVLPENIDNFRCTSGYFYEYSASSLNEIDRIVGRKYQTLAYYGYSKEYLSDLFRSLKPAGIDRIVPIGKTTDFSLTWDGYDLIKSLSRECVVL